MSSRYTPSEVQAAALADIVAERNQQDARFGEQNHDPITWMAILTEEVGEAAKDALRWRFAEPLRYMVHGTRRVKPVEAVREDGLARYREELVQVAAVALAMIECVDRGTWQEPPTEQAKPVPVLRCGYCGETQPCLTHGVARW